MTEPTQPTPSTPPASTPPAPYPAQPLESLARYFEANRQAFTDEALAGAAAAAGYSPAAIETAMSLIRAHEASIPVRQRARRIVLATYLITYGLLVAGMFFSEATRRGGASAVGTAILTGTLGLALLVSLAALRGSGPPRAASASLVGLLAAPLVLLVLVSGLCVASRFPVPRPYDVAPTNGEPAIPPAPAES